MLNYVNDLPGDGRPSWSHGRLFHMRLLERLIRQQQQEYHEKTYVYFRKEAEKHKLKQQAFKDKVDELIACGYQQIHKTTVRKHWKPNTFSLAKDDHKLSLCVYDGKEYGYCFTNYKDDSKNNITANPMPQFKKDFKDRTSKSLIEAFGKSQHDMKVCVPKFIDYKSGYFANYTWYNHVNKEDFSSHFPSQCIGVLPTANGMLEIDGHRKPDAEYPFAFYPDTGHIAIYGEFDTHDCKAMRYFEGMGKDRLFKPDYDKEDKHTILMKAAEYSMAPEIQAAYDRKNSAVKGSPEYKDNKLFLLKFIGQFEQNNAKFYESMPFAHIAAVVKWRANIKMMSLIRQIGPEHIIQICVDGIIHDGKPQGVKEKKLGNLITEYENARFIQRGFNQYIITDGAKEDRIHSGLDINIDKDIIQWKASPKMNFVRHMEDNYHMDTIGTRR